MNFFFGRRHGPDLINKKVMVIVRIVIVGTVLAIVVVEVVVMTIIRGITIHN